MTDAVFVCSQLPYRLLDLLQAGVNPVFIVEGEKDTDPSHQPLPSSKMRKHLAERCGPKGSRKQHQNDQWMLERERNHTAEGEV